MTRTLYLEDAYQKTFEAVVNDTPDPEHVVLDQTCFYPLGGGQPADTGTLTGPDGTIYRVQDVRKQDGQIIHTVDRPGLSKGMQVTGTLDWERRHTLMRYHTAAHILSTLIHEATGAAITGNELYEDRARIDFSLPDFNRDFMTGFVEKANALIARHLPVTTALLSREAAFQIPSVVKLRKALPETIKQIRVISIGDQDRQACGGTHVHNTQEIGTLTITKLENKGKDRKRIYFSLNAPEVVPPQAIK